MSELILVEDSEGSSSVSVVVPTTVEAELIDRRQDVSVVASAGGAVAVRGERSIVDEVLNNRFYVAALLLCAGPIGLPALWFSPRFSRRTKIVTTMLHFLCTAIVPLAVAYYFLEVALRPLVAAFGQ